MLKAQTSLEFAMVVVCLALALAAMQVYIKQGIQGRLRMEADQLGQQYEPRKTTSDTTMEMSSHTIINVWTNKINEITYTTSNALIDYETEHRYGSETVEN